MPLDALPVWSGCGLGFVASHANLTLLELLTQLLVVPSPLAISAVDQPCVLETITSLTIASPFGESPLQSITRGVERDELRPFPFVESEASVRVPELPFRAAEFGSLPVDDSTSEDDAGPGREALPDSPWFVGEADFPDGRDEVRLEILSLRPAELESGSVGDRRDECEAVMYVPQREALGRESPPEISSRHPRRHFVVEQLTV